MVDAPHGTLKVALITPEKAIFSGAATYVSVPGLLGDFGVLPGHAPFISVIRPGVVTIDTLEGQRRVAVIGGISETVPEHCTILVERARDLEEFADTTSIDTLKANLSAAREDLEIAVQKNSYAKQKEAEQEITWAEAVLEALNVAH